MLDIASDECHAYEKLNDRLKNRALRLHCAHGSDTRTPDGADVLLVAQPGSIPGSGTMLLVKVAERGLFTRAEHLSLNGIHGFIGPAPNERLGLVDVLVTGAMTSDTDTAYTGAHFFDDLLHDREISLECVSQERTRHSAVTRLSMMEFARTTIYDMPLDSRLCRMGEGALFPGATIMLNGGRGIILGAGALGSPQKPSVSCAADCFVMDRNLLLPQTETLAPRHVLTLLFPLWKDSKPELLKAAEKLARQHALDEREILYNNEKRMADAVADGALTIVDPGPGPYETILTAA